MKKFFTLLCVAALLVSFAGCATTPTVSPTAPSTAPSVPTTQATTPQRVPMSVPDLANYAQECTATVYVELDGGQATGSGFFIDDQGMMVTSYHVIDAANSITVKTRGGATYNVEKIVDFSEMYDIAVLKVNVTGNAYLKRAPQAGRTGETVYAVGSPKGLEETFSNGIVSNGSRIVGVIDCYQITAAISSGNSGGPLVNEYGEVLGINAFSYTSGSDLNLAVKIEALDKLNMDKNWTLSRYREWYKKEIERSYKVYNYTTKKYELSKINTYHHVTGRKCFASTYDWEMTGIKEGYHDTYGIYCYEYSVTEFDKYTEYLNNNGFVFLESKDYSEGVSYYYTNEFTGYSVDIFITNGQEFVLVEPYCK